MHLSEFSLEGLGFESGPLSPIGDCLDQRNNRVRDFPDHDQEWCDRGNVHCKFFFLQVLKGQHKNCFFVYRVTKLSKDKLRENLVFWKSWRLFFFTIDVMVANESH